MYTNLMTLQVIVEKKYVKIQSKEYSTIINVMDRENLMSLYYMHVTRKSVLRQKHSVRDVCKHPSVALLP